jgi:hypothetical protein
VDQGRLRDRFVGALWEGGAGKEFLDETVCYLVSDGRLLLLQTLYELPDEVTCLGFYFQDVVIGCQTQIGDVSVQSLEEDWEDTV